MAHATPTLVIVTAADRASDLAFAVGLAGHVGAMLHAAGTTVFLPAPGALGEDAAAWASELPGVDGSAMGTLDAGGRFAAALRLRALARTRGRAVEASLFTPDGALIGRAVTLSGAPASFARRLEELLARVSDALTVEAPPRIPLPDLLGVDDLGAALAQLEADGLAYFAARGGSPVAPPVN
jgi:hypothetical protein